MSAGFSMDSHDHVIRLSRDYRSTLASFSRMWNIVRIWAVVVAVAHCHHDCRRPMVVVASYLSLSQSHSLSISLSLSPSSFVSLFLSSFSFSLYVYLCLSLYLFRSPSLSVSLYLSLRPVEPDATNSSFHLPCTPPILPAPCNASTL